MTLLETQQLAHLRRALPPGQETGSRLEPSRRFLVEPLLSRRPGRNRDILPGENREKTGTSWISGGNPAECPGFRFSRCSSGVSSLATALRPAYKSPTFFGSPRLVIQHLCIELNTTAFAQYVFAQLGSLEERDEIQREVFRHAHVLAKLLTVALWTMELARANYLFTRRRAPNNHEPSLPDRTRQSCQSCLEMPVGQSLAWSPLTSTRARAQAPTQNLNSV
jgi:hypothetical protein